MIDLMADPEGLAVVLENDESTPVEFVVELLRSAFGKSATEAAALAEQVGRQGSAISGIFPSAIAKALVSEARDRIAKGGHSLRVAVAPTAAEMAKSAQFCSFCGKRVSADGAHMRGMAATICDVCLLSGTGHISESVKTKQFKFAHEALAWHFAGMPQDQIVATTRQFPGHMRADVQTAVDKLFSTSPIRFFGVYEQHRYETLTFAALTKDGQHAATIAPAQFQDVDVGDARPVQCLNNGLWLRSSGELRYAVVLSFHREFGQESGSCVEIAVPVGERGSQFTRDCFEALEQAINASRSYRGKVLSLDSENDYRGRSKGVLVHRLPPVAREEVILPEATLALLDRNVLVFVKNRDGLRGLGQSTRKGILLYGPPGAGKTHTIRYLASCLPGHTTLIITAGQVALLSQYMSLARLLQPALVVIEDVDLIARSRENMDGPCEESMLNRLLNEMDGLKEDADILFLFTTNRPEQLEAALAGRPGRIDQAIEVPAPDANGRAKLVKLYGKGLQLNETLIEEAVRRTEGVSAAFIKELMRRAAQASLVRGGDQHATQPDFTEALDDMLFTGGRLNVKLLGGAQDLG